MDGSRFALANNYGGYLINQAIWDGNTGTRIGRITHPGIYLNIAMNPQGDRLLAYNHEKLVGVFTNEIYLMDAASATQIEILYHEGVSSAAFSSNGDYVITLGVGGVLLWDAGNGRLVSSFPHEEGVIAAALTSKGDHLATLTSSGTLRLWSVAEQDLVGMACHIAGRNLTINEWRQYFGTQPYHKTCRQWPVHQTVYDEATKLGASEFDADVQAAQELFELITSLEEPQVFSASDAEDALRFAQADGLMEKMYSSIRTGQIPLAIDQYEEAQALDENVEFDFLQDPDALLCYNGAIYGYARLILEFCETGISKIERELAQATDVSDINSFFQFYQGYGIANAQIEEFDTAIVYFQTFLEIWSRGYGGGGV